MSKLLYAYNSSAALGQPRLVRLPGALGEQTTAQGELAATMVLHGAVGTLVAAAAAPKGSEGLWGAAGFALGAMLGQAGIIAVAAAALWRKV